MDVLYIVKRDSPELRWSLRSLAKFGRNLGRVVLAMQQEKPPAWLSDRAEFLHTPRDPRIPRRAFKHVDILCCILFALREAGLGHALYSSDDHFLVADADLDAWPVFRHGDYIRETREGKDHSWWQSIAATRRLLEEHGLYRGAVSGHFNTHLDSRDSAAVEGLIGDRYYEHPFGYEPSGLFVSCALERDPSIALTECRDCKFGSDPGRAGDMLKRLPDTKTLSMSDLRSCPRMAAVFRNVWFRDKCEFER